MEISFYSDKPKNDVLQQIERVAEDYSFFIELQVLYIKGAEISTYENINKFLLLPKINTVCLIVFEEIKLTDVLSQMLSTHSKLILLNLSSEKWLESLKSSLNFMEEKDCFTGQLKLQESSQCYPMIEQWLGEQGERIGVRNHRHIQFILTELILNSFFDAPIDERGVQLYTTFDRRENIVLPKEKSIEFNYHLDEDFVKLNVKDYYGSMPKNTLFFYLLKCLRKGEGQIDQKEGGAGLGLYLIMKKSCHFHLKVIPGEETSFTCYYILNRKFKPTKPSCVSYKYGELS